jgi:hypothetical protein
MRNGGILGLQGKEDNPVANGMDNTQDYLTEIMQNISIRET